MFGELKVGGFKTVRHCEEARRSNLSVEPDCFSNARNNEYK
jgi:hypothetical protein